MNKPTEFQFYRILQEEVTPDDFRNIIQKAVEQAKQGDHAAATQNTNRRKELPP